RLEIDEKSIQPAEDVILSRDDILEVSFHGTSGQSAEYLLSGDAWRPMTEVLEGASGKPSGLYRASLVVTPSSDLTNSPVRFRLHAKAAEAKGVKLVGEGVVEVASRAGVAFWDEGKLRLVRAMGDGTSVRFGIHEVRLGGPYLTELSRGTVLRVTGMRGSNYHVQLCPYLDGWVSSRDVEWAPAGTPLPHLSFTDLSVFGSEQADRAAIAYSAPVPFAVTPTVSPTGRAAIDIDLYGAHNAATWISHRPTSKAVREVTIQQVGTDHVRLRVELNSKQLWGYRYAVTNNAVVLTVRRPPK